MNGSIRISRLTSVIAGVSLIGAGCANVSVRKIDELGRASGPDGIRFYMPRPYVGVNEPFIVAAKSFLVSGQLTPDAQHVLITSADDDLAGHFKSLNGLPTIPASQVHAPTPTPSNAPPSASRAAEPASPASAPPETPSAPAEPADTPATTGQFHLAVANDNETFAVTPFKRYFDIYWLPDFDEQYVVSADAGLTNADTLLNLGQGWSFQGLDTTIDNSAITERLLDLFDTSVDMLTQAARDALLGPGGLLRATPIPGPSPGPSARTEFEGGTPLSIRVTICRVVAPGLYPILKPDEIDAAGGIDAFTSLATSDETTPISDRILVPIPPMTNIAFNTYEIAVVEAARADGGGTLNPPSLTP